MNSQYIFIDLDGTLLNSNTEISEETIKTFQQLPNNINIIISTGRSRFRVEKFLNNNIKCDYYITLNGAEIYDVQNKKVVFKELVDSNVSNYFYNLANDNNTFAKFHSNGITYYNSTDKSAVENTNIDTYINPNNANEFFIKNEILGVVLYGNDYDIIEKLAPHVEKFNQIQLTNYSKGLFKDKHLRDQNDYAFFDFSAAGSSKGKAIKFLQNSLNINKSDCIAIGDGANDIPMFNEVGYVVVVNNATDEIKKYANEITSSNNDSGVAKFLHKKFINN